MKKQWFQKALFSPKYMKIDKKMQKKLKEVFESRQVNYNIQFS